VCVYHPRAKRSKAKQEKKALGRCQRAHIPNQVSVSRSIKNTRAASQPTELHRGTSDESVHPFNPRLCSLSVFPVARTFHFHRIPTPLPHPCPQMSQTFRLRETGHSIIEKRIHVGACLGFLALDPKPNKERKACRLKPKSDTSS
jgi:hypothetical protein